MIPVVPMPVFPGPGRDQAFWADMRASNADRDVAADILCAAVADGRLTLAELDERLGDVLSARTLREIAGLISDLLGPGWAGPDRSHPAVQAPARPQPAAGTRWALLQSLTTPAGPDRCPSPGCPRPAAAGDAAANQWLASYPSCLCVDQALPLVTK